MVTVLTQIFMIWDIQKTEHRPNGLAAKRPFHWGSTGSGASVFCISDIPNHNIRVGGDIWGRLGGTTAPCCFTDSPQPYRFENQGRSGTRREEGGGASMRLLCNLPTWAIPRNTGVWPPPHSWYQGGAGQPSRLLSLKPIGVDRDSREPAAAS